MIIKDKESYLSTPLAWGILSIQEKDKGVCTFVFCCLVLMRLITPDIIANTELLVINGAMYGFVIFDYPNIQLFLGLCITVYIVWSLYCVYHLVKNKEKGNR